MDAQEIKTAVAHQDARAPPPRRRSSTCRDPARALGPDGARPSAGARRSTRTSPTRSGTTGAGSSNRVNDLEEIERILELTDEEREGLSAPDKFRVDITPYFISLIDPDGPERPDPPPGHPDRPRAARRSPR